MRDMGYVEGTPAAICQEALDAIKALWSKKHNEYINNYQALHLAGIKVGGASDDDQHISLQHYEHQYRHQDNPTRVSRGVVWHGWVRNTVDSVDSRGKIKYSHKYHPLQSLYNSVEVVTGTKLVKDWVDILDVGHLDHYRNGCKREVKEFADLQSRILEQREQESLTEKQQEVRDSE